MNTILVIHDQAGWIVSSLAKAGFQTAMAEDSGSGLRKMCEMCPDAIVLSKVADAKEFCCCIRNYCHIPVILLGEGGEFDVATMLEAGADAYLEEPVSHVELVARIRSLLRRYKMNPGYPGFNPKTNQQGGGGQFPQLMQTEPYFVSPRLPAEVWDDYEKQGGGIYKN